MSAKHEVFVLHIDGTPLTPTTWKRARKMIKDGVAKVIWSKFNTPGIQMLVETRKETPDTALGVDSGTKFEGYSVVCGEENNLNVKLDLPDKSKIVRKMDERRSLRKNRRNRTRGRKARFNNRSRNGFITPSQNVVVNSRLKIMKELIRIYPINFCGFEDVKFNHYRNRWGKNFSTMEIGKNKIKNFIKDNGIELFEYRGWETKECREKYGYKKIKEKNKNCFESHCSDSLALAVDVLVGERIEPNDELIVVDDTYRPVRRRLHVSNFKKGGVRKKYSTGIVNKLRKGLLIGTRDGRTGILCGILRGSSSYRFYDKKTRIRKMCVYGNLKYISSNFITSYYGGDKI